MSISEEEEKMMLIEMKVIFTYARLRNYIIMTRRKRKERIGREILTFIIE